MRARPGSPLGARVFRPASAGGGQATRRLKAGAALAALGAAYVALFAANSLVRVRAFTADSMNYVDVARRVVAGDGLVQSTGGFNQPFYLSGDLDLPSAFTAQPPGYPLAIAFVSRFGIDAPDAALVISASAYAAILFLVYLLGRRLGGSAAGAVALGAALLFAPLTHLGRAALSECLAVAFVLVFVLLLDRLPGERAAAAPDESSSGELPAWRGLLAPFSVGLLAGAAFGVRYSLWPLPAIGAVALWLGREARPGRQTARLLPFATFAVGALAPMAWILARNVAADGRLLPEAMPPVRTLGENLGHAVAALFGGWRSTTVGAWPDAVILLAALSFLLVVGAWAARAGRGGVPAGIRPEAPVLGPAAAPAEPGQSAFRAWGSLPLLICVWAVLYLAAIVWRGAQANFDPIGVRLALPATVPLIPVFAALVAAAAAGDAGAPGSRPVRWTAPRRAFHAGRWLPFAILILCLGAALVREAALWSTGRDARAVEFRSERQQWLRDHTRPGDLVVGGGTMDLPFLFPGRYAISYAGLPYTEVLTYPTLERIADRHCADFDRLLLVVRPTVQLGGARSDEDPTDWLGPFIADTRAGRHDPYPLLQPLADLREARIYRVLCP